MAKKKVEKTAQAPQEFDPMADISKIDPEVLENARKEMREGMRERFSEWIEVSDETCGDDFLQEAKADFKAQVEKYENKKYLLATHGDGLALKTAEFLKEFNTNYNKWEKGEWRGVLMFDKVITAHVNELSLNPEKDLEIDYSTLIFLYRAMGEPAGMGIESAKAMARMENYNVETDKPFDVLEGEVVVTYSAILQKVFDYVRELSVVDKMLKLYQERVNIAAAGVRFDFKITELEEFKQFHDAWVVDDVPTDPKELNKIANA